MGYGSRVACVRYEELREDNDIFVDMFASAVFNISIETGELPEPVSMELVSGSYFPTLGVRPAVGRLLDDYDDVEREAHPVVVLSHE